MIKRHRRGGGREKRFFPSSAAGISYIRTELLYRDTLSALTSSLPRFFCFFPLQAPALGSGVGREEESLLSGAADGPANPCDVVLVRR